MIAVLLDLVAERAMSRAARAVAATDCNDPADAVTRECYPVRETQLDHGRNRSPCCMRNRPHAKGVPAGIGEGDPAKDRASRGYVNLKWGDVFLVVLVRCRTVEASRT